MSYCPFFQIRFPDFSRLCFHKPKWKLVGSFHMKSYRSSLTFVTIDLLFHELSPFVQNSFSGLFLAMLSYFWMKVCNKLPYVVLQIKFNFCPGWLNFRHVWPTFMNYRPLFKVRFPEKCTEIMVAYFNLLGTVGIGIALAIFSVCLFFLATETWDHSKTRPSNTSTLLCLIEWIGL